MSPQNDRPSVLVVGSGLAGMTAAFYLAEWGAACRPRPACRPRQAVTLADRAPHLGGAFLQLDHTFTTDSCGLCLALPRQPSYCPTLASEMHPLIALLPCTTLAALQGEAGNLRATLRHTPRYVDPDLCDNCGLCAAACPVFRPPSEWGRSLRPDKAPATKAAPDEASGYATKAAGATKAADATKAIYPPPPRAVPRAYAIDPDVCTRCGACVDICPRGAIDLDSMPTESQIEVAAVVLSPGAAPFVAALAVEYGWGRCANVVTSLEFERMLNRSGPTGGRPLRPSDGLLPRRIAFIQCVGSRSERLGRPYCATSCCMITAKQVSLTKQVAPQTEITVFTLDARAPGKGYERYLEKAVSLPGVTYRWGRPAAIHEVPPHVADAASDVDRDQGPQKLRPQVLRLLTPDGEEMFDLVVLAIGMGPSPDVAELAAAAGIALDEYGFILPGEDGPGSTSRPGVLSAGSGLAPADVPETVTQAAAAAALAAKATGATKAAPDALSGYDQEKDAPRDERYVDILDRPPRVGLFICTCHGTLADAAPQSPMSHRRGASGDGASGDKASVGQMLDLNALADGGRRLAAVAHVEQLQAACEGPGLSAIEQAVAEHDLNRIVVAGCSPHLHADRLNALMERLHLPEHLLARANIREGAAWVHAGSRAATAAARGALEMAVAGLRETPPAPVGSRWVPTGHRDTGTPRHLEETGEGRVLILGGGLAGMTAALTLADLGIHCDLIERTAQLGGHLRDLAQAGAKDILHTLVAHVPAPDNVRSLERSRPIDARTLLAQTVARAQNRERIRIWTEAELVAWSGVRGDFEAGIQVGDRQDQIRRERYGTLIVATGAEPATTPDEASRPDEAPGGEYLYGRHERVLTQVELASRIADLQPASINRTLCPARMQPHGFVGRPASVVMIQCVGSRDETHPYCSRVCCARAIANALALKELDRDIEISILFRDIRTMGIHELGYQQARRLGVRFFRYQPPEKPLVRAHGDKLEVTVHDTLYNDRIVVEADLVVLSTGIAPRQEDNEHLAKLLGVSLDEDGFFAEAHPKLRPTDLARPGIYLCGLAYGPRSMEETISQARAAALRAALDVVRPAQPRQDIATVVQKLCSACGLCVTHCPYGARVLTESERGTHRRYACVIDRLCQGCGVCVAVCPNGASRQPALEPVQVLAMVDAALEETG